MRIESCLSSLARKTMIGFVMGGHGVLIRNFSLFNNMMEKLGLMRSCIIILFWMRILDLPAMAMNEVIGKLIETH